ncbi:MAG: TolC family protein [Casimicrobiaceae bacterium]
MQRHLTYAALSAAALLTGCATFSADGGLERVQTLARERMGPAMSLPPMKSDATTADTLRELLGTPLSREAAVQVALLTSPRVRANLAELGIAEAERVQAGRLANPRYVFGNKRNGEVATIDRTVMFNVLSLFAWPLKQKLATRQFDLAQLRVATDILQVAAETRRAWVDAVAAQQSAKYAGQVAQAASAGGELARRMAAAGNFSALGQMREQALAADADTELARAKLAAVLARERLARLLGVSGTNATFRLPDRLPDLPAVPTEPIDVERVALERRLDVQIAMRDTEALADDLGLTRATRFVNILDLGYTNESNSGEKRRDGYEIELELPLFDWGDARLARAEALYMQSVERTAEVALIARSEVRASYETFRTAWELARRYRDEMVPLRKRIADENVLRYNGMLISIFELLADAREQIAIVKASIDAARDFWNAETNLQLALSGASPASDGPALASMRPASSNSGN